VTVNSTKLAIARMLDQSGALRLGIALQSALFRRSIRIVNYHDVPPQYAKAFDAQLDDLRRWFVPATRTDLDMLLERKTWPHRKPGLIITFDDGLRSQFEVAAPLLDKHGFQGWFFVPIGLVLTPPAEQPRAAERQLVLYEHDTAQDPRVFMTVEQLRDLSRRHVVGCHTANHVRLRSTLQDTELMSEIVDARRELESVVGSDVNSFAWVGGEEYAYSREAAGYIADAYRYCFTTNTRLTRGGCNPLQLDRAHLEADFPRSLVRFQLSGIMDLLYAGKRRRVAAALKG
jgi:peptidoglycan/xylan/chitin deacetylase (PgdA/CDA1 family)